MDAVAKKYRPGKIRANNKKSILAAAEQEFVTHGFKGATMQRIAERANLPKANVHYYFSNKLSLYAAVLSHILKLWDQSFNSLTTEDDPEEALAAYIHTKIMFSRKNPLASRIFAQEIINGGPHLTEYFGEDYRKWFRGHRYSSHGLTGEKWMRLILCTLFFCSGHPPSIMQISLTR